MLKKDHFERLGGHAKRLIAALTFSRSDGGLQLSVPSRMQVDGYCCGLCSARMVAEYHGATIPAARVRRFAKQNPDGTETGAMVRFLRTNGMIVRRFSEGTAKIATILDAILSGWPVIVSVPEHYLVVTGYDRKHFYVNDPALLRSLSGRVSRSAFRRDWTREALIITGIRPRKRHKTAKRTKKRIMAKKKLTK